MGYAGARAVREHEAGARLARAHQERGNRARCADVDLELLRNNVLHRPNIARPRGIFNARDGRLHPRRISRRMAIPA